MASGMDLDKLVQIVHNTTGYKCYERKLEKDEIPTERNYFLYRNGELSRADNGKYKRQFYLSFVTLDMKEVDEIGLIENIRGAGLLFERTEIDYGLIRNTDQEAQMTTFILYYITRGVC